MNTSVDPSRDEQGFTLLETLVALVIAGVALIVMFEVSGEGLFAVHDAAMHERALSVARSRLALARARPAFQPGERAGEDAGGFHWHETDVPIEQSDTPDAVAGTLFRITVHVTWHDGRGKLVLSTLRAAPLREDGRS